MCGIAGVLDYSSPPEPEEVRAMVGTLFHRGPDADGYLFDGPLAMGMRRLSIIDLKTGDQPIYNEDRSVAVVFNGEIFNFVELRQELLGLGHRFGTSSDTETLVHGYEEWGTGLPSRLNGMFAFAMWDRRRQRLILVRDRMGVKPLYYASVGARLCFGSELKALLTQSGLDRSLDLDSCADFLRLGYAPGEASALRAVRRLLPGHYLVADRDGIRSHRWWALEDSHVHESIDAAMERLGPCFDDAVALRMRSDVPVAVFLSGGLDSSLITVAAQRFSDRPLRSLTVGFTQAILDEVPFAKMVARHTGTDHRTVRASPADALAHLPRLVWHLDEPVNDSAILSSYLVSQAAAADVKVCLSGLGGDELFGGYRRYGRGSPGRIRRLFRRTPALAGALADVLREPAPLWSEELRLAADPSLAWREYLQALQVFDGPAIARLGMPAIGRADDLLADVWRRYPGSDWVGRRQFVDQHTYLPDQLLALTDRMSMAVSLEVRVPFMDYRLVGLAAGLPGDLKQRGAEYKIALKRTFADRLPREILDRPKWGFDSPIGRWLESPSMAPLLQQLPRALGDLLDPRQTQRLVRNGVTSGREARRVWALLTLAVWRRVHGAPTAPDATLSEVILDA